MRRQRSDPSVSFYSAMCSLALALTKGMWVCLHDEAWYRGVLRLGQTHSTILILTRGNGLRHLAIAAMPDFPRESVEWSGVRM